MLPYRVLCSFFKENVSFLLGLRFKEEKGCPWKLAVTFARLFSKSSLLPLFFPILFLVLVRVCDSSQRLKHSISFPASLLPMPACFPKGVIWGDIDEHQPRNGVHCSQQREPKSTDCPIHGLDLQEQMLRMVLFARRCPSSGYDLTTWKRAGDRGSAKRGFPRSSTFGHQSCIRMQAVLLH